jgi:hypothetical protein
MFQFCPPPDPAATVITETHDATAAGNSGGDFAIPAGITESPLDLSMAAEPLLSSTPIPESTEQRLVSPQPSTSKDDTYISPAFDLLQLPKQKQKRQRRDPLPKATTGHEALEILRERDRKKKEAEVDKIKRKMVREKKKKEREADKERRRVEREIKKAERLGKKKQPAKKSKTQRPPLPDFDSDSNDSDEPEDEPQYMDAPPPDLSFSNVNKDVCYICAGEEGDEDDWVGCDECARYSHKYCTNDQVLISLQDPDDIADYPYLCQYCDFAN